MDASLPVLAGTVSTAIFAGSVMPMLLKAARTHDLSSYSLGNIVLANAGNVVHSLYVLNLPPGPIWVLHGFYVASSALMLFWYLQFGRVERDLARLLVRICPPARDRRDGYVTRTYERWPPGFDAPPDMTRPAARAET